MSGSTIDPSGEVVIAEAELADRIEANTPLLVDRSSGELYLPIDEDLRLTTAQYSDIAVQLETHNDPKVWPWTASPARPFKESDSRAWIEKSLVSANKIVGRWRTGDFSTPDGCPVSIIRNKEGAWVGDFGVHRFGYHDDPTEGPRLADLNRLRTPGDPNLLWSIGYMLKTSETGRGVMGRVLRTMMDRWIVPVLRADRVIADTWTGNEGSRATMQKIGFKFIGEGVGVENADRGGNKRAVWVFLWGKQASDPTDELYGYPPKHSLEAHE